MITKRKCCIFISFYIRLKVVRYYKVAVNVFREKSIASLGGVRKHLSHTNFRHRRAQPRDITRHIAVVFIHNGYRKFVNHAVAKNRRHEKQGKQRKYQRREKITRPRCQYLTFSFHYSPKTTMMILVFHGLLLFSCDIVITTLNANC